MEHTVPRFLPNRILDVDKERPSVRHHRLLIGRIHSTPAILQRGRHKWGSGRGESKKGGDPNPGLLSLSLVLASMLPSHSTGILGTSPGASGQYSAFGTQLYKVE